MNRRALLALSLLGVVLAQCPVQAATLEPRIALVIGNAAYRETPLRTPVNDATDMASMLKGLGFEVTLLRDADLPAMKAALRSYGERLSRGGVGLFYFAGRGIQSQGEHYLIPVGARLAQEQDLGSQGLATNRVLEAIGHAGNPLSVVILAASRNNPLARGARAKARGLAMMEARSGTLIAYACAPGSVASDGPGRNSVYTKALLQNLTRPGVDIESVFKIVRVAVMKESGGTQVPWESSSLGPGTESFLLAPPR